MPKMKISRLMFYSTVLTKLADELEEFGYDAYLPEGADSESALA